MTDDTPRDLLTEAEEALRSILSPAGGNSSPAVRPLELEEFHDAAAAVATDHGKTVGVEQLDLRIELGRTHLNTNDVRQLRSGSVISLDKLSGDPVDVYAGPRLVARGEAIVLDGKLGVRVLEVVRL